MSRIKKGDFSSLAKDYGKYRPSYNRMIVDFLVGAANRPHFEIEAADVGAGTGIFTKLLSEKNFKTLYAIEPNDNMREEGKNFIANSVQWIGASAEDTTLPSNSIDIVSMASSFHWPDTQKALAEFNRLLRANGLFVAIWNPRMTELSRTENEIAALLEGKYQITNRVSSGRSGITNELSKILRASTYFKVVTYCEAMDVVNVTPQHYIGAWRSVNDVRSQLGEEKFEQFIGDVTSMTSHLEYVDVHYLTRAWIARK